MSSALSENTLGIDFGTSNSAAGVCVGGKPFLIPIEEGETTLPTAVFFGLDAREITLGRPAGRALIAGDEGRYMRALKSVLGTSLMGERRSFLGKPMTFYDIIAHFLKQIKTRAEAACFTTFDHALSGRPVQFHSRDKERDVQAQKDLTECYMRAGFKSVRFMLEPEAAALATQSMAQDGLCLIVDIGGGTSDFSVFEAKGDGIQVRASQGIRLGGTDFDKILSVQHVMPLLGRGAEIRKEMGAGVLPTPNSLFQKLATWEQIPFMYAQDVKRDVARMHRLAVRPELLGRLVDVLDLELGHEIAFSVEAGKIRANSGEEDAKIQLNMVEKALEASLTPEQLFRSLEEEVTQIRQGALDTIERAQCSPEEISKVIFVGGSSLLGPVQKILEATCPQAELAQAEAFTAVIDGLALASADPYRYGAASA